MQIAEPLLGTRAEVHAIAGSASASRAVEEAVLAHVRRLEGLFTIFDPASALNRLRRSGTTAVPELLKVLDLAQLWHGRSCGAFDPRMQGLMSLWEQAEAADVVPSDEELAAALGARDRVSFADNLNAIAKGWIAQHAVETVAVLSTAGVDSGVDSLWLSLGGDVVHHGAGTMTVGIEDPHRPYDNVAPLATVEISNEAVATSGGSHRWWTIQDQRYPKVLDPRTGWPVTRVASATVVAPDAATADVLATIATVADVAASFDLAQSVGADCLLILADGSQHQTSPRFLIR